MSGYKPAGRHQERKLTAAAVRNLGPGLHGDGGNLYLRVDPSGARRWIVRLMVQGKRRDHGLGSASLVSLAEAREAALQHRKIARVGDDPLAEKRRSQGVPTFKKAALLFHEQNEPNWRNDKHRKQWLSTMETYVFPTLGSKSVGKIESADIVAALDPIWGTKPETARRIKQRIGIVLKWAIARGYRTDNPADAVQQGMARHDRSNVKRMKSLPFREVKNAIDKVKESSASDATKLAFYLLIHTACRSNEVRKAEWKEFDLENRLWEIPGSRMKGKKDHTIPLSKGVLVLLEQAKALRREDTDLVFPSLTGKALSDSTLSKLMRELDIPAVPHGFRASFREWAGETTNHAREVIEHALAHQLQDKTEAAYQRTTLIAKRRVLMEDWSKFLTQRGGSDGEDKAVAK